MRMRASHNPSKTKRQNAINSGLVNRNVFFLFLEAGSSIPAAWSSSSEVFLPGGLGEKERQGGCYISSSQKGIKPILRTRSHDQDS